MIFFIIFSFFFFISETKVLDDHFGGNQLEEQFQQFQHFHDQYKKWEQSLLQQSEDNYPQFGHKNKEEEYPEESEERQSVRAAKSLPKSGQKPSASGQQKAGQGKATGAQQQNYQSSAQSPSAQNYAQGQSPSAQQYEQQNYAQGESTSAQNFGGHSFEGSLVFGRNRRKKKNCLKRRPTEPPYDVEDVIPEDEEQPVDSQQPPNYTAGQEGKPCDKPGADETTVEELCSLPPMKGSGNEDIFRYYFNPIVQQCIPFSYSGAGGNANRFVSVKNCYEICHPADPDVKKPRVVSGIRAYLVPNQKANCPQKEKKLEKEVVVRQIPHPLDPMKTLTIVQDTKYIPRQQGSGSTVQGSDPRQGQRPIHILHEFVDEPYLI